MYLLVARQAIKTPLAQSQGLVGPIKLLEDILLKRSM